jgi:hypothetical protein
MSALWHRSAHSPVNDAKQTVTPGKLTQPGRVRRAGDRADRCLSDCSLGVAVGGEGLTLGCAGSSMWFGETIKRVQAEPSYNRSRSGIACWEKPV